MRITLPSGTPAELAEPPGGRGGRGLVIATDINGLRPLFDEHCRRLADEQGWAVCAVELWPGRQGLTPEEKWALVPEVDEQDVIDDLEAAADVLNRRSVGLIGFCMGGMYAFRAAGMSTRFDRVVSFYGMIHLPKDAHSRTQSEPINALRRERVAPVLALMGEHDPWCPLEDIEALEKVGGHVRVERYPEASHAFAHDPSRDLYREKDAHDAWQKTIEFLEDTSKHSRKVHERKPGILGSSPS